VCELLDVTMLTELRETRGEDQGEFCSTIAPTHATHDTSDGAYKTLETVLDGNVTL